MHLATGEIAQKSIFSGFIIEINTANYWREAEGFDQLRGGQVRGGQGKLKKPS
jgi:hypothetical protein